MASTREVIWGRLVDAPSYPDWNRAMVHVAGAVVDGGHLVATQVDGSRVRFAVQGMEAENRMTWRHSVIPGLVSESLVFLLGDSADGVRVELAQQVHGPLSTVLGRVVPNRSAVLESFLTCLKTSVEAQSAGAAE